MMLRILGKRNLEELKTINNLKLAPKSANRGMFRKISSYYNNVKRKVGELTAVLGDNLTEQIRLACSPHTKLKLRLQAIQELIDKGEMLNNLFMKKISGKIKIPEFAKVGKKPRLIGDFSCPGSLLAGFLVPCLKFAFSDAIVIDGSRFRFVYTTDAAELDGIFNDADQSIYDEYIFFSDDVCCKINVDGVHKWFNLDVSQMDASNGPAIFSRMSWFFDNFTHHKDLIDLAVRQCMQRLVIFHPAGKKIPERVTCKPSQPIEFSGTQLTTALNNAGVVAICISISHYLKHHRRIGESIDELIARAALAVGYEVTLQHCDDVENIQFLKHSFYRDSNTGSLHSFVNLGPLIRGFGTCWMDIDYSRKLGETLQGAWRQRNWSVLQGFKHSGLDLITQPLLFSKGCQRQKGKYTQLTNRLVKENSYKMYTNSQSIRKPVPLISLMKRYSFNDDEFNQLIKLIVRSDIGHVIACSAVDKIMQVDNRSI